MVRQGPEGAFGEGMAHMRIDIYTEPEQVDESDLEDAENRYERELTER